MYKAFAQAKRLSDAEFAETTALKIGLPWVNAEFDETRAIMGEDFWSYGIDAANRKTLDAMARYSYRAGPCGTLADRRGDVRRKHDRRRDESLARTIRKSGYRFSDKIVRKVRRRHAGSADLRVAQPADDGGNGRVPAGRASPVLPASCRAAPRRCTRSIPTLWWCSGPIISTASSTR